MAVVAELGSLGRLYTFMNAQPVSSSRRHSEMWGWFGGQIGSTVWLICSALRLGSHKAPGVFSLLLICFAVANLIGLALWTQRQKIGARLALRLMLVAVFICDLVGMIFLRNRPEFARELSPATFAAFGIVVVSVFTVLHRRESPNQVF